MATHALVTIGALLLALFFFTVPLVLKYHVFKPLHKRVSTGDVVTVDERHSSVWCRGAEFTADARFKAFAYDSYPEVDESELVKSVTTHRITLRNKAQKYWAFHLLRGSQVTLSTCVRLPGADVTVVQGRDAVGRCQQEHRKNVVNRIDKSEEDSESESESDAITSSISSSQGAVSNESDSRFVCSNALLYVRVPSTYRCGQALANPGRKHTLFHDVLESDFYYYIFSTDTYLDIIPNEFAVEFSIARTHYKYSSSSSNCSSIGDCLLAIPMRSTQTIVVQMEGVNGTLKEEDLQIACKPRESLFLLFYAGFFVVIFLCAFQ